MVITYADLCAAEAENILLAVNLHLKRRKNPNRKWLTEDYIRKVHRDMFGGVWEWAGIYRKSQYNIGVSLDKIRDEIGKLCGDVFFWDSQKDQSMMILERAVRLHHRLSWIHPFPNGNGRHARMMADIYLHVHRHPLPMWPSGDISRVTRMRKRYLSALRMADFGNFAPLVAYTRILLPNTR